MLISSAGIGYPISRYRNAEEEITPTLQPAT